MATGAIILGCGGGASTVIEGDSNFSAALIAASSSSPSASMVDCFEVFASVFAFGQVFGSGKEEIEEVEELEDDEEDG